MESVLISNYLSIFLQFLNAHREGFEFAIGIMFKDLLIRVLLLRSLFEIEKFFLSFESGDLTK